MYPVYAYLVYLLISTALTIWVAKTLFRNGQIFLVQAFDNNESLASSVNHLLVVGFYLVNIGYVTLALSYGAKPGDLQQMIEFLSWKIGLVLVVLGFMHFMNLGVFSDMRRKAIARRDLAAYRPPHAPMRKE